MIEWNWLEWIGAFHLAIDIAIGVVLFICLIFYLADRIISRNKEFAKAIFGYYRDRKVRERDEKRKNGP